MNVETSGLKGVAEEWGTSQRSQGGSHLQDVYKSLTIFSSGTAPGCRIKTRNAGYRGVDLQSEIAAAYIASFRNSADRMPGKWNPPGRPLAIDPEGAAR